MWTLRKINGIPKQVRSATSAVVGDKIYSFGGFYTLDDYQEIKPMNVHIMETVDYQWRVLKTPDSSSLQYEEIPLNRKWHTVVVHNDLVYIFGGFVFPSRQCEDTLYCFNTRTHLWSRPSVHGEKPTDCVNHSACVINNSMYIFGDPGLEINQLTRQQVYKLNLNSFEWSLVRTRGEPPICRGYSATAINNYIYFFGGCTDEQRGNLNPVVVPDDIYDDQVIVLDTQTMSWIRPEVNGYRPEGRMCHSAFCYRGQLFIFGGWSEIIGQRKDHNDLVRYDPESRCWSVLKPTGNGPFSLCSKSCCVIGDRVFLFGGIGFSIDEPTAESKGFYDLHVLDFEPSLKTLAVNKVLDFKLNQDGLPETIRAHIKGITMTTPIPQLSTE